MYRHTLFVCLVCIFPLFSFSLVNSEHMSSLPTLTSPSLGLPSATPSPSLGLPSAATPPSSTAPTAVSCVESSGPRTLPPHLGFSQSKDVPSTAPLTVNFRGSELTVDLSVVSQRLIVCLTAKNPNAKT